MNPSQHIKKLKATWQNRLFDSLSYPSVIIAPDKTIVSANTKFYKTYLMSLEEVQGQKCYNRFLFRGTPCDSEKCPISRVLNEKTSHTFTIKHRHRWEERVFSPILDEQGNVEYIIGSLRDVTRTKNLDSQLSNVKEFISQVIHSSASAIIAADRKGNIELMNKMAKRLFKIDEDGKKITHTNQLYPPGKAQEIMQMLKDDSITGRGKLLLPNMNIVNSEGEQIPVEMSAAIIYDEIGNESATMAIYNTLQDKIEVGKELKDARNKLVQSEKMASLGKLSAGVAHEINNPLTGVLFYASLLLERDDINDSIKEDLGYIVEDANRCKDIVKSLLVYSRNTGLKKKILDINTIVERSLKLTRDQKKFRNITIVKDFSPDLKPIYADINKLSQVVINIVINAVDSMEESGTLTLHTYHDNVNKKIFLEKL